MPVRWQYAAISRAAMFIVSAASVARTAPALAASTSCRASTPTAATATGERRQTDLLRTTELEDAERAALDRCQPLHGTHGIPAIRHYARPATRTNVHTATTVTPGGQLAGR
jgi:hypothetical protein